MVQGLGVAVAGASLLFSVLVYLLKRRSDHQLDVASLVPALEVANVIRKAVLEDNNHTCCSCRESKDVGLYRASLKSQISGRGLFVLCEECASNINRSRSPLVDVLRLKHSWEAVASDRAKREDLKMRADQLYREAVRRSLEPDWRSLLVAKGICDLVLREYDPSSSEVRLLLQTLVQAEQNAWGRRTEGYKLHGPGTTLNRSVLAILGVLLLVLALLSATWLRGVPAVVTALIVMVALVALAAVAHQTWAVRAVIIVFLWPTMLGELAHVGAAYALGAVRNVKGHRMPVPMMVRYIEVEGAPFWEGIQGAVQRSLVSPAIHVPGAAVNLSKMQRDWYCQL